MLTEKKDDYISWWETLHPETTPFAVVIPVEQTCNITEQGQNYEISSFTVIPEGDGLQEEENVLLVNRTHYSMRGSLPSSSNALRESPIISTIPSGPPSLLVDSCDVNLQQQESSWRVKTSNVEIAEPDRLLCSTSLRKLLCRRGHLLDIIVGSSLCLAAIASTASLEASGTLVYVVANILFFIGNEGGCFLYLTLLPAVIVLVLTESLLLVISVLITELMAMIAFILCLLFGGIETGMDWHQYIRAECHKIRRVARSVHWNWPLSRVFLWRRLASFFHQWNLCQVDKYSSSSPPPQQQPSLVVDRTSMTVNNTTSLQLHEIIVPVAELVPKMDTALVGHITVAPVMVTIDEVECP